MSKKTAQARMTQQPRLEPDEKLCQLLGLRREGLGELLGKLRLATVGAPPTLCDYCRQEVEHLALRYNCVALLVAVEPRGRATTEQPVKAITPGEGRLADDRRRLAVQVGRREDQRESALEREGFNQRLAKSGRNP